MADGKAPPEWFKTHPVPDAQHSGKQVVGPRIVEWGVASWCPTPDGTGKPEAVAFHVDLEGGASILIRLKSRAEVNRLITMLLRHADEVWPESASVPS